LGKKIRKKSQGPSIYVNLWAGRNDGVSGGRRGRRRVLSGKQNMGGGEEDSKRKMLFREEGEERAGLGAEDQWVARARVQPGGGEY